MDAPHGLKTNRNDSEELNTHGIKIARTGELLSNTPAQLINVKMDIEHEMCMNHITFLGLKALTWGATIPRIMDSANTPSAQLNNLQKIVEILVDEFDYHGDSIEMRKLINNCLTFSRSSCEEIAGKCYAICQKYFEHLNFTFICFKENDFLSFNQIEMQLLINNSAYFKKLKEFSANINSLKNNTTNLLDIAVSDFEQVTSNALQISTENVYFPGQVNFKAFKVIHYLPMPTIDIEKWAEEHNQENDIEPALPSVLQLGIVSNYLDFDNYNESSCTNIGSYVPNLTVSAKLSLHAYLMGNDGVVYVNDKLRSVFAKSFGKDLVNSTKVKKKSDLLSTGNLIDSFVGCKISDISLETMILPIDISKLSTLTKLKIVRPSVDRRHVIRQIDFNALVGLNLNSLSLKLNHYDEIETENINHIGNMKIEHFDLSYNKNLYIGNLIFSCNKILPTLCGFPLKTLKLKKISGFTDLLLGKIGQISTLTILKISSQISNDMTSITNVGLAALGNASLEHLTLNHLKKSNDDETSFFRNFKLLKTFNFVFYDSQFIIDDEAIKNMLHLPLTKLMINAQDRVSKEMLLRVSKISSLKELNVEFKVLRQKEILPLATQPINPMPARMDPPVFMNMMPAPMNPFIPGNMIMPMQMMPMQMMPGPMGAPMMPGPMGAPMMPGPMGAPMMPGPMGVFMPQHPVRQTKFDYIKIIRFHTPKEVSIFIDNCMSTKLHTNDIILEADIQRYQPTLKPTNKNVQVMEIETEPMTDMKID